MFTTYVGLEVIHAPGSYWAGLTVALAAGVVLGAVAELADIRPSLGKPELNSVIITIGLLILLEEWAGILYGGQYRSFPAAFSIIGLNAGSTPRREPGAGRNSPNATRPRPGVVTKLRPRPSARPRHGRAAAGNAASRWTR
jgi:hypothetical protein